MFAFAALTPLATAGTVVPPGNSAATQYTETFPTSGGEADVNKEIDASNLAPSKVLGKSKAHDLESQGADGKAVAEIAAVTAPSPVATEPEATPGRGGGKKESNSGPAGNGGNSGGNGGGPAGNPANGGAAEPAAPRSVSVSEPSGSSGLGEVLGQATGSSSGQLGLLLPLLIIGTVIWSLNYAWRQRRTAA
ncbi:MAG: hypothetical protein ACOYD4_09840 [Solirubrobacterales bacterium]